MTKAVRVIRYTRWMEINEHLCWYGDHRGLQMAMGLVTDFWRVSRLHGSAIRLAVSNLPETVCGLSYPVVSIHAAHYGVLVQLALTQPQAYDSLYMRGTLGSWIMSAYEDQLTNLSLEEEYYE